MFLEVYGPPRVVTLAELGVPKLPNYGQPLDKHPIDTGRMHRVIERVTELSRWNERKAEGRALGLAAHRSFLSYVAVVASVVKDPGGKVRVDEAWVVVDAGTVINPDRVRAQMEGSVVFGMSLAMLGEVTMKGGAVQQSSFRGAAPGQVARPDTRLDLPPAARRVERPHQPPGGVPARPPPPRQFRP